MWKEREEEKDIIILLTGSMLQKGYKKKEKQTLLDSPNKKSPNWTKLNQKEKIQAIIFSQTFPKRGKGKIVNIPMSLIMHNVAIMMNSVGYEWEF